MTLITLTPEKTVVCSNEQISLYPIHINRLIIRLIRGLKEATSYREYFSVNAILFNKILQKKRAFSSCVWTET